jgi:hypothetical protein
MYRSLRLGRYGDTTNFGRRIDLNIPGDAVENRKTSSISPRIKLHLGPPITLSEFYNVDCGSTVMFTS